MDSSSSSENYSIESVSSTNNDQEESMRSVSSRFRSQLEGNEDGYVAFLAFNS